MMQDRQTSIIIGLAVTFGLVIAAIVAYSLVLIADAGRGAMALVVPPDLFFVLGDNRDNSLDSRYFGFVTAHQVLGRVRRVYFSRDTLTGIRWSRIGLLLQ
jgi:hypothetical protein